MTGSNFKSGRVAGLALCALLAGCDDIRQTLGAEKKDSGLCSPVPPARQEPAADAYQQAIQRDECIHRWSYRLAAAPDTAEAVVGAVIGACRAQIDRSASMIGQGDPEAERWYLSEMERVARERALYRVIQARAGDCR